MTKKLGYFARLLPATRYSLQGIRAAYRHEAAFRQEVWLAVIFIPLACWLASSLVELAVLLSTIVILLITELLNSAIEAVVDRIGPEQNELSGRAKDLGSAAVFIAVGYFILIWTGKIYLIITA